MPPVFGAHALQMIHALHDLPHLVASLGHEPLWEPFDARTLRPGPRGESQLEAAIVGRAGDFTWYAVSSDEPSRAAPRIARRLTERGRICAVLALDARDRRLAVSVGFGTAPVLDVDLASPTRLATSCLTRIGGAQEGGALAMSARIAEALSGAGVGARFFATFQATLDRFIAALPPAVPGRHRHELALLQLTRVLFLYFVQAKGWLDGSARFLRDRVDDCLFRRRRIHADFLLPLFFGTLNLPVPARGRTARAFGRIPFLNGGLFEPHRLERAHRAHLPDTLWRDAFDSLFERFHFTAVEGDAGGIAPDMLGRVFEGVMEPRARKASGTYYTPRSMVRDLVDAALAGCVAARIGVTEDVAHTRLEAGDPAALASVARLTILDPAVGSGAFLLGALERLGSLGAGSPRRIVGRHLFGVDINPSAVRLCELRLWLAVIAAEPDGDPGQVEPLPNLDAFVRQGDSLSDPLRLMLRHPVRGTTTGPALAAARQAATTASGASKRRALRQLHRLEADTAAERLAAAIAQHERRVAELAAPEPAPDFFPQRHAPGPRRERALAAARRELSTLKEIHRRLVEDGVTPAFDFDTQFADVMQRGGFDIVIGNPPWVRAESLSAPVRSQLGERFRWWRQGGARGFGHQPDLSVAFLERGWEVTARGGVLAMLVPAKVATAGYGTVARADLAARGCVLAVAEPRASRGERFDATVYPLAIVARASPPPPGHRARATLDPCAMATVALPSDGSPWLIRGPALDGMLANLARHPRLRDSLHVHLGVKTGANHVYLDPPAEVEPALVRPALRGRDLRAFHASPSATLLWTHDLRGAPLPALPPGAARHLARHADALAARADGRGLPPWSLFRATAGVMGPKVVWADLASRLEAVALTGEVAAGWVPLNSCYVIRCRVEAEALALAAWLNSSVARTAARAAADVASGGYSRFNARAVGLVPLPPPVLRDHRLAAIGRRGANGEDVQTELDSYACDSLGLEPGDRRLLAEVVAVGAARRR